jgi:hypothetical protein
MNRSSYQVNATEVLRDQDIVHPLCILFVSHASPNQMIDMVFTYNMTVSHKHSPHILVDIRAADLFIV